MIKDKVYSKIKRVFIPAGENNTEAFKEVAPFFILITVVLVFLYDQTLKALESQNTAFKVGISALFLIHLVIYWTIFHFSKTDRRKWTYLSLQGGIAFMLVQLSGSMSVAIGLYSALIGNIVGFLGKSRQTVFGVALYTFMAMLNLALLNQWEGVLQFLIPGLPALVMAAFFSYFIQRQLEAREKAHILLQELEQAHKQLTEYALEVEDLTLTNERQRMARELHDTLAQGLAGLILQLEAADLHLEQGKSEKSKEILQQAMSRARSTLVDARQAIDDLRTSFSGGRSLGDALNQEAERFQRAAGIACQISLDLPDQLEDSLAEHIFRIATEGLENILRHAQAKSVQLSLAQNGSTLKFDLQDDGVGFDQEAEESLRGHYGLLGIRERVRLAGGSLTIESQAGEGTRLQAVFPLDEINGGQADE